MPFCASRHPYQFQFFCSNKFLFYISLIPSLVPFLLWSYSKHNNTTFTLQHTNIIKRLQFISCFQVYTRIIILLMLYFDEHFMLVQHHGVPHPEYISLVVSWNSPPPSSSHLEKIFQRHTSWIYFVWHGYVPHLDYICIAEFGLAPCPACFNYTSLNITLWIGFLWIHALLPRSIQEPAQFDIFNSSTFKWDSFGDVPSHPSLCRYLFH